jgi:hypothetical protein
LRNTARQTRVRSIDKLLASVVLFSRIIVIRSSYKKVVEMIVHLNDGIIAAMPDDPVGGSYNEQGVFTAAAAPPQCYGNSMTVISSCGYNENNVFKQPASPPRAYQTSPPLAGQSPVAVLSLRRHAERFYAEQRALGRSLGPHIFLRQSH